jgi:hypothetical protein
MSFNTLTLDCTCGKCNYSWKARTEEAPKKCPSCGSMAWNSGSRKFTSILARAGQTMPDNSREFCILELLTHPGDKTSDIFYLSADSIKTYFNRVRMPGGSVILFYGEFEIGEDKVLYIKGIYSG